MELHGSNGNRDQRGLISHTVPYLAKDFEEVLTVGESSYGGVPETARTWRHDVGGAYLVEITYEGSTKDDAKLAADATYDLRPSFREEAIEGHPQIAELIKKFNGQRDNSTQKVTFPATLSGSTGTNGLAGESGVSKETPNPMAGVEKYMALEVSWTKKYVAKNLPPSIFSSIGRVTKSPPGQPPIHIPKRESWLVMPPTASKHGNIWEITEEYTLLPEGTPAAVYNIGIGSTDSGSMDSLGGQRVADGSSSVMAGSSGYGISSGVTGGAGLGGGAVI